MTRALLAAIALTATACSVDTRSDGFRCSDDDQCDGDRVCTEGWCVPSSSTDGGSDECPEACSDCVAGTCVIDCEGTGSCSGGIVCPAGLDCDISCTGEASCSGDIDCSNADDCDIACDGAGSCSGSLTCTFSGACQIDCATQTSCGGSIDCSESCACDVDCDGDCQSPATCPMGADCETVDGGCKDTGQCDSC